MTSQQKVGLSYFFFYKDRIEQEIAKSIATFGEKTKLRDACEYALTSGGKRFRPLVVLLIAEGLDRGLNVCQAALSVEFFHTASLIVDDLPCMDNDEQRRERPSVHKVYGESIALLASYALISAAFEKIHDSVLVMREAGPPFCAFSERVGVIALEHASKSAGIFGATGGQFLDLFPLHVNLESVRRLIQKKTITLFEVAFVFGWLFGGGDLGLLEKVKRAAFHVGMAFQVADDIQDLSRDGERRKEGSIARFLGRERALALFHEEMAQFQSQLEELHLDTPSFQKMRELLVKRAYTSAGSGAVS